LSKSAKNSLTLQKGLDNAFGTPIKERSQDKFDVNRINTTYRKLEVLKDKEIEIGNYKISIEKSEPS
jgi:hypothetical protein